MGRELAEEVEGLPLSDGDVGVYHCWPEVGTKGQEQKCQCRLGGGQWVDYLALWAETYPLRISPL
jgi:hypothetical protein